MLRTRVDRLPYGFVGLCRPSFADDAAFKFRKNTEHSKHSSTSGCGSVESLLVQEQIDALIMQNLQDAQQISQGPAQAIDGPSGQQVELSSQAWETAVMLKAENRGP